MKTAQELIEENQWEEPGGVMVISSEKADHILGVYAEEYAKAFIEYSRAERFGLWELPDLFESFKEFLKK